MNACYPLRFRWRSVAKRVRRLAWPEDRRGWGALAVLFVFACHVARYATEGGRSQYPNGDGFYSWLYARSIAFDGDVDLTNDYALCGDPWGLGRDEGGGRPANPFYLGPSVFWAPLMAVLRHVVRFAPNAPDVVRKGCHGPLATAVGAVAPLAVLVTVWLAYRVARRWCSEEACALSVLVIGLASPLNCFGSIVWYYSHVWAAMSVALGLLLAVRADEAPEKKGRWILAGAGVGLAALMRPQEGLWAFVAVASIAAHAWRERRQVVLSRLLGTTLTRLALLTVGFAIVFSAQVVVYQKVYGAPFVIPQGKLYVQLGHAHPWLLMFSARAGLLYWTPLLWLTIIGGVVWLFRGDRRAIVAAVIVVMGAEFYLASAVLAWTGGATIGARIATSLAAGLTPAAAASLEKVLRWARRRRLRSGAFIAAVVGPWIAITWEIAASGVPYGEPVPAPQLYGTAAKFGMTAVYDKIGNPWSLPFTVPFWIRYGAPPKVFDQLANDGIFQKHYRTLAIENDTLSFTAPPACYWSDTIDAKEPVIVPGRRSRFLLALYWPWTTKLRVRAKARSGPVDLRIRTTSLFRIHEVGTAHFEKDETVVISVPRGAFDSGINEVLLDASAPLTIVSMQWIDELNRDTGVHLLRGR